MPARTHGPDAGADSGGGAGGGESAAAQDLSPISGMLETIAAALTGPIGQALAVIAVIVAGIALIALGRFDAGYLAALVIGVVLILQADDIVAGFSAGGE